MSKDEDRSSASNSKEISLLGYSTKQPRYAHVHAKGEPSRHFTRHSNISNVAKSLQQVGNVSTTVCKNTLRNVPKESFFHPTIRIIKQGTQAPGNDSQTEVSTKKTKPTVQKVRNASSKTKPKNTKKEVNGSSSDSSDEWFGEDESESDVDVTAAEDEVEESPPVDKTPHRTSRPRKDRKRRRLNPSNLETKSSAAGTASEDSDQYTAVEDDVSPKQNQEENAAHALQKIQLELDEHFDSPLRQKLSMRINVDEGKLSAEGRNLQRREAETMVLLVDARVVAVKGSQTGRKSTPSRTKGTSMQRDNVAFANIPIRIKKSDISKRSTIVTDPDAAPAQLPRSVKGSVKISNKTSVLSFRKNPVKLDKCHIIACWFKYSKRDFGRGIWRALVCSKSDPRNAAQKFTHLAFTRNSKSSRVEACLYKPTPNSEYGVSYTFQAPHPSKPDKMEPYDLMKETDGWHHLALLSNGSQEVSRLYIDGMFVGEANAACNAAVYEVGNSAHETQNAGEKAFPEFADLRVYNFGSDFGSVWTSNLPVSVREQLEQDYPDQAALAFQATQMLNLYTGYSELAETVYPQGLVWRSLGDEPAESEERSDDFEEDSDTEADGVPAPTQAPGLREGKGRRTVASLPCTFARGCEHCPEAKEELKRIVSRLAMVAHCQETKQVRMEDIVALTLQEGDLAPCLLVEYRVGKANEPRFHRLLNTFLRACHLQMCVPEHEVLLDLLDQRGGGPARPSDLFLSVVFGLAGGDLSVACRLVALVDYLCASWFAFALLALRLSLGKQAVAVAEKVNLSDIQLARAFCDCLRGELTALVDAHVDRCCACAAATRGCVLVQLGLERDPLRAVLSAHAVLADERLRACPPGVPHKFFGEVLWRSMPCVICNEFIEVSVPSDDSVACAGAGCVTRCHLSCLEKTSQDKYELERKHAYITGQSLPVPWHCAACALSRDLCRAVSTSDHALTLQLACEGGSPFWHCAAHAGQTALHLAALRNDVTALNILLFPFLRDSEHARWPGPIEHFQLSPVLLARGSSLSRESPLAAAVRLHHHDTALQLAYRTARRACRSLRLVGRAGPEAAVASRQDEVLDAVQMTGRLPAKMVKHPRSDYAAGAELVPLPWSNAKDAEPVEQRPYLCSVVEHSSVWVDWGKVKGFGRGCGCRGGQCGGTQSGRLTCFSLHNSNELRSECNQFCGCAGDGGFFSFRGRMGQVKRYPDCGRRSVQNGVTVRMKLFRTSNGRGWGVKADQAIRAGSFLTEYVGELITRAEAKRRENLVPEDSMYTWKIGVKKDAFQIDATRASGISAFFNHQCSDANVKVVQLFSKLHQDRRAATVAFFAARDIEPEEELCCDYLQGEMYSNPSKKGSKVFKVCKCNYCETEHKK